MLRVSRAVFADLFAAACSVVVALAFLAVALWGSLAHAQEAVISKPTTVGEMLLAYIVGPLLTALGAVAVAALGKLVTYLHAKEKDGKAFAALAQASELVQAYVAKADVELRPEFQKALADGKLTPEEGAALKAKVLELLKRDMPASLMALLSKVLGGAVDGWLSGKVEQAVAAKADSPA